MKYILRLPVFLLLALPCFARAADKPNILFFAVDDLRPEFGAYGSPIVKSPNLDRIARAGVTFNRAYCQQALCSPTRSSLMTGTRPDTTKVWDLVTRFRAALPNVATLGQHFKHHGYFVQGMGKICHRWKLGEHDAWCKHSNVENDTNAPLLLAVPGMQHAGTRTSALVELVDIYPTLSELYDHQSDPQENLNIAKAPVNAALIERLMAQWREGWRGVRP